MKIRKDHTAPNDWRFVWWEDSSGGYVDVYSPDGKRFSRTAGAVTRKVAAQEFAKFVKRHVREAE